MNPQQVPTNYLDQISAPVSKRRGLAPGQRRIVIILASLTLLVIIGLIAVNVITQSRRGPWEVLTAQLAATQKIADSATPNIKSSRLRSLNSEVKLFLTNTTQNIKQPLLAVKVSSKELPKSITSTYSADSALARLEDARLNAVYDRAYAREMTYQLALVLSQLKVVYGASTDSATKALLENTYKNLEATHASLSDYSENN